MPGLILDAEGAAVARWEARRGRLGSLSGATLRLSPKFLCTDPLAAAGEAPRVLDARHAYERASGPRLLCAQKYSSIA